MRWMRDGDDDDDDMVGKEKRFSVVGYLLEFYSRPINYMHREKEKSPDQI